MAESEDLYEILQVHPSAQQEIIEAAYRRLALLYHPDQNSSREATEMMARINRAFEVLNDPEKRAEYDRNNQRTTPTPVQRPRRNSRQPALDYITIGSRKDDVSRIQGPADNTYFFEYWDNQETWSYGSTESGGSVTFNKSGRVIGWYNRGDLKVRLVPGPNATTSESFSIGSHKDDVARLQGTPLSIIPPTRYTLSREERAFNREFGIQVEEQSREERDRETWQYLGGIVDFSSSSGRVTAFQNQDGSLKAQVRQSTLGSKEGVIRRSQREPTRRYSFLRMVPGPNVTSEQFFRVGSHKDDVIRLQGTPRSIDVMELLGYETWMFSGGTVIFSLADNRVIYYKSDDGSLRTQWLDPGFSLDHAMAGVSKAQREKENRQATRFAFGCVGSVVAIFALLVIAGSICR